MTRDGFGREAVAQPLASPAAAAEHPLRDWTERARGTALEALRYTRFVGFMKRALPIAAAAILASVIAYSVAPRRQERVSLTYQRMGTLRNDLAMIKPRLTGTDANGNPFVITADAAIQDAKNKHRATLEKVDADLQLDGQHWLNASAETGFFDMDAGTLKLGGGIALYTDSGYELHTQSADVDLKKNIFSGENAVIGHGPLGSLRADRFQIDRLKKHMNLSGHVHMVMVPKKARR
ncbi:MAG: LPS export ABC transporter periplasmic protein LptC [Rhizomicrobium sp.]|jgi:lipopolysaccharide export system protein LptC